MTTFKANRKFPNPITVTDDPKSHTLALQQIIEALNIGQRRTKEVNSSYVRVHELVDAGLIEIVGNQLKLTNAGAAATTVGASALADLTDVDLTGLTDGDTLVYNSATLKWEPAIGGAGLTDLYDQTLNNLADVGFYMPEDGDVLTYNAATGLWDAIAVSQTVAAYGAATPGQLFEIFEDFQLLYRVSTDIHEWAGVASGVGSGVSQFQGAADGVHFGMVKLETGTTTTGYGAVGLQPDLTASYRGAVSLHATEPTTIECLFYLDALPTTAQNYVWRMGLGDAWVGPVDACRASIDWDGANVRASIVNIVAAGGGGTTSATVTGLAALTWVHVRLVMTTGSQQMYVNGTLVVSSANNAPATTMNPGVILVKTAGTTEVYTVVDLIWLHRRYSTPRHANLSAPEVTFGIDALGDVDVPTPADGDLLTYNSATGMWESAAPVAALSDLYDQTLNNLADVGFYMPEDGDVLTYNAATGMWDSMRPSGTSISPANPGNIFQIFEDFEYLYRTSTDVHKWTSAVLGAGSNVSQFVGTGDGVHHGLVKLETGTTTTGNAQLALQPAPATPYAGAVSLHATDETVMECLFYLNALPNGTETYNFRFGLGDASTGTTEACRVLIGWDGANVTVTYSNTVASATTSDTATITTLVANTWTHIKLVATASVQRVYIDGVLVVSATRTASTSQMNPHVAMVKTAGTTEVFAVVDLVWIHRQYSTPRHPNLSVL